MGVFVSEKFAPGSQPGVLVSSSFLTRFPGPSRSWLAFAVAAALLSLSALGQSTPNHFAVPTDYGKLPLAFEANQGQSDPQVKFLARGHGYELFLTDRAAELALNKSENAPSKQNQGKDGRISRITSRAVKTDLVRMELAGASRGLQVTGSEQLPGKVNYFIGNDPAKWHTHIPTYARVKYAGVYPGVNLVYYGNQRQLEYDFVISPGADPKPVRLHFAGAAKLKLKADGDLEVIARNGAIAIRKPEIYQIKDGQRRLIEGSFRLTAKNNVGFALGSYDHTRELVIDPTLVYSTYLGGSGIFMENDYGDQGDYGLAIAVDGAGNAYVTGLSWSSDFPVTARAFHEPLRGHYGVFVTKINPAGTALLYSAYLSGSGAGGGTGSVPILLGDSGNSIAVDSSGNAYIAGTTFSHNFPVTPHAFQKVNLGGVYMNVLGPPGGNAFVTKLNATGSALLYSTYLGGMTTEFGGDMGTGIAVGSSGIAYVTGQAASLDFPVTSNPFQKVNNGGLQAFVTALDPSGSSLYYSSYLGGGNDKGSGIALDAAGNAYVTGSTSSSNFPVTSGAFQKVLKAMNAFVSKINAEGSELIYSTFLGGSGGDQGNSIAVDTFGDAYVTGMTYSADFPVTAGAFQKENKGKTRDASNGFVTEVNPTGSGLVYSTYLGGNGIGYGEWGDSGNGIAVDSAGYAYVAGYTNSTNFPVTDEAFQKVNNAAALATANAFLTKVNAQGSTLLYSTYFGGSGANIPQGEYANGIAVDAAGNAYLAGTAYSSNLPLTPNAFQQTNNAAAITASNAFVARFAITTPLISTATSLSSGTNPAKIPKTVTFTADLTAESGTEIPTGTVSFAIDGGAPVSVALDASGQASYSTPSLAAGQHTVVAAYSGDLHYSASSTSLTQTMVGPPAKITALSGSGQVTTYGSWFADPLILLVTDANGLPVFDTPVTFSGNGLVFLHQLAATDSGGTVAMNVKTTAANIALTADATVSGFPPVAFSEYATDALLKVTPKNVTVHYGEAIPAVTYTITGFVNGNGYSVVTGAPTEYTEAVKGSPIGTYPILLSQGTLAAPNYGFDLLQGTLTITSDGTAAKPSFSPPGSTYASGQMITITDSTPGAVIYYTTDGSTPTTKSPIYIGPITLNASQTISALAAAVGYTNSEIQSERYWIK